MNSPQDPAPLAQDGTSAPRLAAIDLGSNSFHLLVAGYRNHRLQIISRLGEKVQLAAGLDDSGTLDDASMARGLRCLEQFAPLLEGVTPRHLRIVGTSALREATNSGAFIELARSRLGHQIEIISGHEEARLIYLGAAHALAARDLDDQALGPANRRLVTDIGGGSTEVIIGEGFAPLALESLSMGCVTFSRRFFADGEITEQRMRRAELAALSELAAICPAYRELGWQQAVGTSGTLQAAASVLAKSGDCREGQITRGGLIELRRRLIEFKHLDRVSLEGLKPDRARVFPAGMAILGAIFEAFGLEQMDYTDGALREGVLYDLVGLHD
ncbi:hypothetical protein GRB80_13350 [Halomonas sp. D1-1]|uniref:Ppx/GppA phosphatase N-terminal domain-containing protein n=1 Tax=Halomonas icarae TaxID=2691040 RepID=A0A7X4W115_9GAMM|nr:hypothetical protein [Halomonas icarae]